MREGTAVTSERIGADVWLIRLTGHNDRQTTPRIRRALVEGLRDGGTVMVDLSAATSIDRQVIGTIVAAHLDTERLGGGQAVGRRASRHVVPPLARPRPRRHRPEHARHP